MSTNGALNRKLRMGLVGGGQGAFIGRVHATAAVLDNRAALVAGALSSDPAKAKASAADYDISPQRAYGSYGLEVIGIACESGSLAQQRAQVAQARVRYSMAYTTLLSGGGAGPCPVRTQFEIRAFPTLVLVDEAGNIVWRSEGLDEYRLADLKGQIQRRLALPGE